MRAELTGFVEYKPLVVGRLERASHRFSRVSHLFVVFVVVVVVVFVVVVAVAVVAVSCCGVLLGIRVCFVVKLIFRSLTYCCHHP